MDDLFYHHGTPWFDYLANGSILLLILFFAIFVGWFIYSVVTGRKRDRADLKRMLTGLDQDTFKPEIGDITAGFEHASFAPSGTAYVAPRRPFAPENRGKRRKLTADS